jgi:ABC-type branched-subunit amino acid transport system substrate-binding protein/outer membrane murein-binding lipoprotein Lpp
MQAPNIRAKRVGSLLAAVVSGALILAACGSDSKEHNASPAAAPGSPSVDAPAVNAPATPEATAAPDAASTAAPEATSATPASPGSSNSAAPSPASPGATGAKSPSSKAAKGASAASGSGGAASAQGAPGAPVPTPGGAAPAPGAPGRTGGSSDVGISATEIKTGGINMHGMPLGNLLVDPQIRGMNAAAAAINDAGGIHGRKLRYIDCDDGPGETSRAKACMKKLVEQDKIFSMLTTLSWSSAAIGDDLARYQIPLVGAWAYSHTEWKDPWQFPTHMSMLHEAFAGAEWVRDVIKPKTFGLICLNAPEMQKACSNVNQVLTDAGAKMVHKVDVTLTPGDLSAEVVAMRSKNPDHIIHYVINPASIAKFVVDAAQQQYWPPKGMSGNHLAAEILGEIFGDWPVNRYWTNTTYKLWGPEYMATIRKYAPNNQGLNHHIVQAGYVATNIFANAMKQVGPEPTRQKLLQVLNSPGSIWDAGPGLDQKFMWAPGQRDTEGTGTRREYMYKYVDANTTANKDNSPRGFAPDPDKFVITDTYPDDDPITGTKFQKK